MRLIIGGLEGIQIHPLNNAPSTGKMEGNRYYIANELLKGVFAKTFYEDVSNLKKHKNYDPTMEQPPLCDYETAKAFFGITNNDIIIAGLTPNILPPTPPTEDAV